MKKLLVVVGVVALASMVSASCGSGGTGTGGGTGGSGGGSSAGGGTGGGTAGGSGGGTAGGSGGGTAGGSGGGTAGGSGGGTAGGSGGGTAGGAGGGTAGGAGGGTAGGAGGGTAGGSGGAGGGSMMVDAGMPPQITLTFMPMCPTLTACGGDQIGTWHYSSGCVSSDLLFSQARQLCPSLTLTNLSGDSRGSVVFNTMTVQRNILTNLSGTMTIPDACNVVNNCATVQTQLATQFATFTCTGTTGDCVCAFTQAIGTASIVPYTKSGNQITTEPGTAQTKNYDYCITGTAPNINFQYRELGTNPRDPGIFVMGKK